MWSKLGLGTRTQCHFQIIWFRICFIHAHREFETHIIWIQSRCAHPNYNRKIMQTQPGLYGTNLTVRTNNIGAICITLLLCGHKRTLERKVCSVQLPMSIYRKQSCYSWAPRICQHQFSFLVILSLKLSFALLSFYHKSYGEVLFGDNRTSPLCLVCHPSARSICQPRLFAPGYHAVILLPRFRKLRL